LSAAADEVSQVDGPTTEDVFCCVDNGAVAADCFEVGFGGVGKCGSALLGKIIWAVWCAIWAEPGDLDAPILDKA
jgi:hypothetical protein